MKNKTWHVIGMYNSEEKGYVSADFTVCGCETIQDAIKAAEEYGFREISSAYRGTDTI